MSDDRDPLGTPDADQLAAEALATLSHELRTPLAAIKGYATTLLRHDRRLSQAERREALQAISAASDRLDTLIGQLLRLARPATGCTTSVDLAALARAALDAVRERAAPARHAATFALWSATPAPLVRGDPALIREVLDCLLENAVRFSPAGGPVEIIIAHHDPQVALIRVTVRDCGMGIAPDDLERIFLPFHQAETGLARGSSGLGLGLAICRRVVAEHGGNLWAESIPGQGSSFHFTLPLAAPEPPVLE